MNRHEMEKAIKMLQRALKNQSVDYIAYCPICLGFASVKEESEDSLVIECTNTKCPMVSYTMDIKKAREFNE